MDVKQIKTLVPGKEYLVVCRLFDPVSGKHRTSRKVKRVFKYTENRFGEIPCAVFSSRVTRCNPNQRGELSIPHFDLIVADLSN